MPQYNRGVRFRAEIPTPDEVGALIRASSGRAPTGIRNRAIVALLWRGGLRATELCNVMPWDIDDSHSSLIVQSVKGRPARTVVLDPGTLALIARWRDRRPSAPRGPLFCTLRGTRLNPVYLRQLLPRLARRAGIEKRIHAHGLRHAHAVELAREGYSIDDIRDQLGHASIATTDVYLRRVAPESRLARLAQRPGWTL